MKFLEKKNKNLNIFNRDEMLSALMNIQFELLIINERQPIFKILFIDTEFNGKQAKQYIIMHLS